MDRLRKITTFTDPAGAVRLPANIHPGPDDRMWFTSLGSDRSARLDPGARDPGSTIETFTAEGLLQAITAAIARDGGNTNTVYTANGSHA